MGALRLLFRAEFRRRWRSWLALATLIAVVGGVVLAAAAAGRRTESAFPRFVAAYGFNAGVYSMRPAPKLAKLPEVSSATGVVGPFSGQPACDCANPINPTDFEVLVVPPGSSPIYKLVSGHRPDPSAPDQVLASFTLQNEGVHLGSVIHVPFYSAAQASAYDNAIGAPPRPDGPVVAFRVVGFEAAETEFPSGSTPSYDLYATPAFARTVLPRTATGELYLVRLRDGAAGVPQFSQQAGSLGVEAFNLTEMAASVQASIHPQAVGWWILAVLAALVALAVVGQALVRQSIVESEDYPTMAAVGADRRQLLALGLARNVAVGLAGAAGAVVVATALSPLAPLGEARIAETSTGVTFDLPVLALGALATVLVVFGLGIWPALRATRTLRPRKRTGESRPSTVVALLAGLGAPPSAMIGVRNALERRSGGATVPVGAALTGTALAVAALCATGVFGASLSNLTATPRLYGAPFQLNISNPSGGGPPPALLASLEHNKAVTGIMKGFAAQVSVNKITVGAAVVTPIKGLILLSTVSGHVPDGDGQIGLGATTMRQAGARLGSVVRVTVPSPLGGRRTASFRVVSQISFPVLSGLSLGTGSAFTIPGYENAACSPGPRHPACLRALYSEPAPGGVLVSFVPGPRGQAAISHYLDTYQSIAALVIAPTALVNFGEAVNFPLIFGAMLAVFGAATLVHLLVVSVSRRRREIGLLKALGFVNGQVAATVAWQATTVATVGIIIGVPLGILIGRTMWSAFAGNLGFVPVAIVQAWLLAALIAGVLVAANLLAALPALAARRYQAGQLLRTQ